MIALLTLLLSIARLMSLAWALDSNTSLVATLDASSATPRLFLNNLSDRGILRASRSIDLQNLQSDLGQSLPSGQNAYGSPVLMQAILSQDNRLLVCWFVTTSGGVILVYDVTDGKRVSRVNPKVDSRVVWIAWRRGNVLRYVEKDDSRAVGSYSVIDHTPAKGTSQVVQTDLQKIVYPPEYVPYRRSADQATKWFLSLGIRPPPIGESAGLFTSTLLGTYSGSSTGVVSLTERLAAVRSHGEVVVLRGQQLLGRIPLGDDDVITGMEFVRNFLAIAYDAPKKRVQVWNCKPFGKAATLEGDFVVRRAILGERK
jgi:hypothetical protein